MFTLTHSYVHLRCDMTDWYVRFRCDFGSATTRAKVYEGRREILEEEETIQKTTTIAYRAPEMVRLDSFAEYSLFYRALLQKTTTIAYRARTVCLIRMFHTVCVALCCSAHPIRLDVHICLLHGMTTTIAYRAPPKWCDMTHWYVWHDSLICVTWLVDMCDVTHWYMWHDSFIFWRRREPFQKQLSIAYRDSWQCVTCLIHMCDMTRSYVCHDSFICVTWLDYIL